MSTFHCRSTFVLLSTYLLYQSTIAFTSVTNTVGCCNGFVSSSSSLHAQLVFESQIDVVSEAIPKDDAKAFFTTSTFRNFCLSAGETRPLTENVPWTPTLQARWNDRIGYHDSVQLSRRTLPKLFAAYTTLSFPGLLMNTTAYVAWCPCDVAASAHTTATEQHEIWLVGESQSITGAMPAVWLYRKLVGSNNSNNSTQSLTVIRLLDKDASSVAISMRANVTIQVQFPDLLVRILPTSRERMQQQGSTAVTNALQKDLQRVMDELPDLYSSWKRKETPS